MKRIGKRLLNHKGTALPMAIFVMILVLSMMAVYVSSLSNEARIRTATEERLIAKYAAEAGAEQALFMVNQSGTSAAISIQNAEIRESGQLISRYSVSKDNEGLRITSEGRSILKDRKVKIVVDLSEDGKVANWKETND